MSAYGVRIEHQTVRGWRNEFRCWWKMAKYVEVVFDKSRNPGSISICRKCCQVLSRRMCSGETELTAVGCEYHRTHAEVPFAVKSTVMSVRWREMLRPDMSIFYYYLQPGQTDLMHVSWVRQIREDNKETAKPRNLYLHQETCLHGTEPQSIIQGVGVCGIYWKRCDGMYVNALGYELEYHQPDHSSRTAKTLDYNLAIEPEKVAEEAWRTHHPDESDEESGEKQTRRRRQRWQCVVM